MNTSILTAARPSPTTHGGGTRWSIVHSAVLATAATASIAYLWYLVVATPTGEPIRSPSSATHNARSESLGLMLRRFDLGTKGVIAAEYCKGDRYLRLRHTPLDGSLPISNWARDTGFGIVDVALASSSADSLLIYGPGEDGQPPCIREVASLKLPLAGTTVKVVGGRVSNDVTDVPRCAGELQPISDSEYLLASMRIGGELAQGLPPDHTPTTSVQSVEEVLVHNLVSRSEMSGTYTVESTCVLKLEGVTHVQEHASVSIEVGQLQGVSPEFQTQIAVDGGPLQSVTNSITSEPAIPSELNSLLSSSDKRVYHITVALPSETHRFVLYVTHTDTAPHSGLQSWYYGVQDFGRQQKLEKGYDAYVFWNTEIDRNSVRTMPACGSGLDLEWLDAVPTGVLRDGVKAPIANELRGFHARVSPSSPAAFVLYVPQSGK